MTKVQATGAQRLALAALLGAGAALAAANAEASTYAVKSPLDTKDKTPGNNVCADSAGRCTLRAAVEEANAHAGYDVITLEATTYFITLGYLQINGDVDIYGSSTGTSVIDPGRTSRVLRIGIPGGTDTYVYMYRVALQNGSDASGGAIKIEDANDGFAGDRLVVANNRSTGSMGGGVLNGGTFSCYECEITGNTTPISSGGGTQHAGGGVFNASNSYAFIYNTTIAQNNATRGGGLAGGGYLEMQNSTISTNTARGGGGGFSTTATDATWGISYTTITKNKANTSFVNEPALGGGFFHRGGTLEIGKSIIAGNEDNRFSGNVDFSPDCGVSPTVPIVLSHWDNLWGNVGQQCRVKSVFGGSITGLDRYGTSDSPLLVELGGLAAAPGAPTRTHAPTPFSYPVDEVSSGNPTGWWLMDCPFDDQIHTTRPQRNACDTGSFEVRF
jgi:hypothetical protein